MTNQTVAALYNARFCLIDMIDVLDIVNRRPGFSRRPGVAAGLQSVTDQLGVHLAAVQAVGLALSVPAELAEAVDPAPWMLAGSKDRAAHRRAVSRSLSACRFLLQRVDMLLADKGLTAGAALHASVFEADTPRGRRRRRVDTGARQSYRQILTAG